MCCSHSHGVAGKALWAEVEMLEMADCRRMLNGLLQAEERV